MIKAWILYYSHECYHFEERDGASFANTAPSDWGLLPEDEVILILQSASFLQAWLEGTPVRKW